MKVQEDKVDLSKILMIVKKGYATIIIFSLMGLILSSIITFKFTIPKYQVKTQLIVHSSEDSKQTTAQEIQGNVQIINTYNDILVSPIVLNQVISQLHLNYTASELQKNIKLSTETNSQVITMSVIDNNKFVAKDIANYTVEVFKTEVSKIMNVNNVSVLAPAVVSEDASPVSPNKKINLSLGLFLGGLIGFVLVFAKDLSDQTVKTAQDIEELTNLSVYGEIPVIKIGERDE